MQEFQIEIKEELARVETIQAETLGVDRLQLTGQIF